MYIYVCVFFCVYIYIYIYIYVYIMSYKYYRGAFSLFFHYFQAATKIILHITNLSLEYQTHESN